MKSYSLIIIAFLLLPACKSGRIQEEPQKTELSANPSGAGPAVSLEFRKGKSHNHPSFVFWAEDMEGKYLQTLFITKAVGTSIYDHGDPSSGHWEPGEIRRPASLPYWAHQRGVTGSRRNVCPDPWRIRLQMPIRGRHLRAISALFPASMIHLHGNSGYFLRSISHGTGTSIGRTINIRMILST